MTEHKPPRKPCTAWETETGTDDDPLFVVLTLHHGLGEMTRVDLSAEDARDLAAVLIAEADATDAENAERLAACPACGSPIDYCQGHGEMGDPAGARVLAMHDDDDHSECHPEGCQLAAERQTQNT